MKTKIVNKRSATQAFHYDYDPHDPVDSTIGQYLNAKGQSVPVKRIDTNKYLFGTKHIDVYERQGQFYVNDNGRTIDLDIFLDTFQGEEMQKLHVMDSNQELVVGSGSKGKAEYR